MEQILLSVNIYQILVFIEVVEQNGFAKAGQSLHLTQPAITKNITKLEHELGFKLFERSTRKIEVTKAGSYLYKEWKNQVSQLQKSYKEAFLIANKDINKLNIAITSTTNPGTYFWEIKNRFIEKYPDVELNIESDSMDVLCEKLISEQYDIIFVPHFERYTLDEAKMPWKWAAKSNCIVIVPKGNRLWERKFLTMEDIKDETFVELDPDIRPDYQRDLNELFERYGYKPKIGKIYKNAYSLRLVYNMTDGLLLTDRYMDFNESISIKKIPLKDHYNGIICSWNPKIRTPYTLKFIDSL
jgi:DNA-binding transcriptional LysR family regulator